MKERGIIMSAPMVRAILDGRKTQTRRLVGIDEPPKRSNPWLGGDGRWYWHTGRGVFNDDTRRCPYGIAGDRLWVRETFVTHILGGGFGRKGTPDYAYRATVAGDAGRFKWKPSIFMPRAASRITLEVTGVRVERVQEISGYDAIKEGCERGAQFDPNGKTAIEAYRALWESLNAKRAPWASNPWVWVIEFRALK